MNEALQVLGNWHFWVSVALFPLAQALYIREVIRIHRDGLAALKAQQAKVSV